jgi:hypothetical protein
VWATRILFLDLSPGTGRGSPGSRILECGQVRDDSSRIGQAGGQVDDRGQMTSVSRCNLPTATWAVHGWAFRSMSVTAVGRPRFDPPRPTFDLSPTDNLHEKREIVTENWLPVVPTVVGITGGASCLNNLIEDTILRVYELRAIPLNLRTRFWPLKKAR